MEDSYGMVIAGYSVREVERLRGYDGERGERPDIKQLMLAP
jgi:hypothetical protein